MYPFSSSSLLLFFLLSCDEQRVYMVVFGRLYSICISVGAGRPGPSLVKTSSVSCSALRLIACEGFTCIGWTTILTLFGRLETLFSLTYFHMSEVSTHQYTQLYVTYQERRVVQRHAVAVEEPDGDDTTRHDDDNAAWQRRSSMATILVTP